MITAGVVHLVRHAETISYESDAGLTERGREQARERGRLLATSLPQSASVLLAHAPAERARETAETLRTVLHAEAGPRLEIAECTVEPDFRNVQVQLNGVELDPTEARVQLGSHAGWALEAERFWQAHQDGDAMGFWLLTPLLWHESPQTVVRRMLHGIVRHASRLTSEHLVAVTHSGCMRALVAWAAGGDQGEPFNAEEVVAAADLHQSTVEITYRNRTWHMSLDGIVV